MTTAEVTAQAALRTIPDDLVELGKMLKAAGQSPSEINDVLTEAAKVSDKEVTWVYMDVYNTFAYTAEDKLMDATHLDDFLMERKERGLYYALYHGEEPTEDGLAWGAGGSNFHE